MGSRKFHGGMFAVAVKSHKLVGPGGLGVGVLRSFLGRGISGGSWRLMRVAFCAEEVLSSS